MVHSVINSFWYTRHPLRWLLYPLALVYQLVITIRRWYLKRYKASQKNVPVIVVGNLTVGGAGKTPLVIALAGKLQSKGLTVGIVSRGYGALVKQFPHEIYPDSHAALVGDEPLLIAQKTRCPVVIAPKRVDAVRYLLDKYQCQIIISDDGLQHYRMARAMEIVVIDGARGLGNGLCLPAGPLREPTSRLKSVDFVITNGGEWPSAYRMDFIPGELRHLSEGYTIALDEIQQPIAAVAGIGNPGRFYTTLDTLSLRYTPYSFPDHHLFEPRDLIFYEKSIVMTEKDAVKCRPFATETMFFLPVNAKLSDVFWTAFFSHALFKGLLKR